MHLIGHLWPVQLYSIFIHYLINGTIFICKELLNVKMCVLILSTTFFLKYLAFWEEMSEI